MIIRVFRARVGETYNNDFERFLRHGPLPFIAARPGLVAQYVGRPLDATGKEFVYVTVWEDVDSLRGFAGEDWQRAVIDPEEEHMLEETLIDHYEAIGG